MKTAKVNVTTPQEVIANTQGGTIFDSLLDAQTMEKQLLGLTAVSFSEGLDLQIFYDSSKCSSF